MPTTDTVTPYIDIEACDTVIPKAAIVLFQGQKEQYLEFHDIRRDGSMGPAKGVTQDFINALIAGFSAEYKSTPFGAIPENLLYCDSRQGNEIFIWYTPPGKRVRYFSDRLGLEDGEYHVPGTIYVVVGNTLSVFCFKGKKPKMDDILLGVPYFNVYHDGKVCLGSAARPHDTLKNMNYTYANILKAWENTFWNSRDVHTNGSPSTKGNLVDTIKKYKDKAFDTDALTTRSDQLTLKRLISKYEFK